MDCFYGCGRLRSAFVDALPVTFWLVAGSALIAIGLGVGLALVCVRHRGRWQDRAILTAATAAYSVPSIVLAALLWAFLAFKWGIFPEGGYVCAAAVSAPLYAEHVAYTTPSENHLTDCTLVDGRPTDVVSLEGVPIGPTWQREFFLGADENGRDLAVRLLYGARASLLIDVAAIALTLLMAVPLALAAGYIRGRTDASRTAKATAVRSRRRRRSESTHGPRVRTAARRGARPTLTPLPPPRHYRPPQPPARLHHL